jgi:hypothetical protein
MYTRGPWQALAGKNGRYTGVPVTVITGVSTLEKKFAAWLSMNLLADSLEIKSFPLNVAIRVFGYIESPIIEPKTWIVLFVDYAIVESARSIPYGGLNSPM